MLTCAIRDLHLSYPGEYQTDVRTSCNSIFDHNPYITKLNHRSRDVRTIPMHYHGRINDCNSRPGHFCEAFTAYLSAELKRPIRKHCIRGDIYVSEFERKNNPIGGKYWLVLDGGKSDYTTKHYSHERIQEVVNYFQGKIQFVQVGQSGRRGSLTHFNRPLENVINYLDKTDIRQWIHLTHHAEGVLCGVTGQMHLAAAVPTPEGKPKNRAAVIFGGGREPVQWYQYPFHQVLHTNGLLPCCENGGCWRKQNCTFERWRR